MNENKLFHILSSHELWLKTRGRQGYRADLSFHNLQGVSLKNRNLTGALIIGSNMKDTNLSNTVLRYALISHSDLRGANLTETDFSYAALVKVRASSHELSKSTLTGTHVCHLEDEENGLPFTRKIKTTLIILSGQNITKH